MLRMATRILHRSARRVQRERRPWTFSTPSATPRSFGCARSFHRACADILVKLEWENPTGSMKDRMAQAVIARAEEDGRLEAGRHGRRVHGRQHRGLARPGLRRQGLPHPDRQLRRVQPGEAGSHGGAGRGADARPERGRPHDQEADPGHDRDRARAEPGAAHLLDRPAQQPRQHRGLLPAGRGDLESDERRGRRVRPLRGHGARPRAASRPCSSDTSRASGSSSSSPPNPRCCWAVQPGPHKIEGVGDRLHASALGAGARGRDRGGHDRRREGDGAGASRGRRACSPGLRPAPTSSPRSGSPSGWARAPRWSR